DVSGSSSSAVADLSFSGARDFNKGLINHTEWRLGYQYSNIPGKEISLKDATLLAQSFAATKPLGSLGLIFRFGASIEGGNRQTNLNGTMIPAADLAQSGYGAAKIYVGTTANSGK